MLKASDLRNNKKFKESKQEPCFVCGKHRAITQSHHLITLKKCAEIMNQTSVKSINAPLIWLCPNCHSYVHKLISLDFISVAREERIYKSISKSEYDLLVAIGRKNEALEGEILTEWLKELEAI